MRCQKFESRCCIWKMWEGFVWNGMPEGQVTEWQLLPMASPSQTFVGFLFFLFRQSFCPFLASLLLTIAEYKGYFWCNSPISCLLISHKFSCWSVSWLWESHSPKCYSQQGFYTSLRRLWIVLELGKKLHKYIDIYIHTYIWIRHFSEY